MYKKEEATKGACQAATSKGTGLSTTRGVSATKDGCGIKYKLPGAIQETRPFYEEATEDWAPHTAYSIWRTGPFLVGRPAAAPSAAPAGPGAGTAAGSPPYSPRMNATSALLSLTPPLPSQTPAKYTTFNASKSPFCMTPSLPLPPYHPPSNAPHACASSTRWRFVRSSSRRSCCRSPLTSRICVISRACRRSSASFGGSAPKIC